MRKSSNKKRSPDDALARLRRAMAAKSGDTSWEDHLPEGDDLPDDEDDVRAEVLAHRRK